MQCPNCSTANAEGVKFCVTCGTRLALTCPTCGSPVTPGQRFCGECGTPLLPGAATPPPAAPTTQRRVCSVLFCDLVGFTPMSESRDPEAVRELLSRYFDTARTVIGRYGGVVEKFIGDAVMAVWGTPTATEDDAERATRAGIELVEAVSGLRSDVRVPTLAARAGVVTGEVAVNLQAVGQGMVAGDAVNTAARVQAAAEPGEVLVDESTFRRAEAAIAFSDAGTRPLKGKAEPVRLWRAERVLAGVGGVQRLDGLEAPLIGREVELRLLKDLFHATVARRTPRLVVVTGPAGSGKSRLGWEFEKYLDGIADAVLWHRGRCLSYGQGVAFWAVAEMVRQRLGIAEEDPVEVALPKLTDGVALHLEDPLEREYVGVRLGRLLGLPFPGDDGRELAREELFAGWRTWLVRLAATEPVVWLIEDLQYADVALLDFLEHLLDWAGGVPLYLLAFARPELEEERPGWSSGRQRQQVSLDPLDDAAMATLLDALVPGMPPAAVDAITRQARGVPLFAIETIRALIDRELVVPREGTYRLVGDLGELEVPDTLRGLLAARLDHLAPEQRALVADAAVLGAVFPAEALAAVAGRPVEAIRPLLLELVRRELLTVSADPLSPQRGTFGFAHDLLRRVAYDTLSRHDRRTRHLAAADHLRSAFPNEGEEVADVVARHLLDAADAVPEAPDAQEIRERAVGELLRAGDRARRLGAQARAAASYAEAAERTTDPAAAVEHLLRASLASRFAARVPQAVEQAERARDLATAQGDRRGAALAEASAGITLGQTGRFDDAQPRLLRALEVLREEPDVETVVTLYALAAGAVFAGSPDADRLTTEVLDLAERLGVPMATQAMILVGRGTYHLFAGHALRGVAYMREAARLAEQAGDARIVGLARNNLAVMLSTTDPAGALEAARSALEHVRRVGDRRNSAIALVNVVETLVQLGRWSEAADELAGMAETLDELDPFVLASGELAAVRGDADRARTAAATVLELGSQDQEVAAAVALVLAFAADATGNATEAREQAARILELRDAVGLDHFAVRWGWPLAARVAHTLGDRSGEQRLVELLDGYRPAQLSPMLLAERELARGRMEPGADGERLAAAVAEVRAASSPFHLAHALADAAEHALLAGRPGEASPLLAEAEEIADRLGAAPLDRRLQRCRERLLTALAV